MPCRARTYPDIKCIRISDVFMLYVKLQKCNQPVSFMSVIFNHTECRVKGCVLILQSCAEGLAGLTVMTRIIDQHNQMIELYRYLHAQAGAASAKELLQSLITMEEHEAMQMVMGNNRLQDV
jgi:hypothetical protein